MGAGRAAWSWIKPEVYPLIVTVGGGALVAVGYTTRKALFDPDCKWSKTNRGSGIPQGPNAVAEGEAFKYNILRRFLLNRVPHIFPNAMIIKKQEGELV